MSSFELCSLQDHIDTAQSSKDVHLRPQPVESYSTDPVTRSTMIYVLCAALNSCNLGYDIGVSTNVSKLIQDDMQLSDRQREVFIGFINFWASKSIILFGRCSLRYVVSLINLVASLIYII